MMPGAADSSVAFDVTYREQASRLTTFFRYFTALPHVLVLGVIGYAVQLAALAQWFIIVFTGQRNEGIWSFQRGWLSYASRVNSYSALAHDVFPSFWSWGSEPVSFEHHYAAPADRLTNGLRLIWIIPAALIAVVLGIAAAFVLIIVWFAILFTGRVPRGMWDFIVRVLRFNLDLNAYGALMTDEYPRYNGSTPNGVLPPGEHAVPVQFYPSAPPPGQVPPPPTR